jgi:hypothetical protein
MLTEMYDFFKRTERETYISETEKYMKFENLNL